MGLQLEEINNPLFSLVTRLFREVMTFSLEKPAKLDLKSSSAKSKVPWEVWRLLS